MRFEFVVFALVVAIGGCSMPKASDFRPSKLFSLGDDDEPEKGIPVRIVSTWTDTVLSQPGRKPQRGFGGRLMFYERNEDKPILVDGQLVVYAFDETNRAVTDNKPTRRYVFPPDQMPLHMSKSELGASYSFWLPWDEAGGPQTEVSLICRFEPKGGAVVTSEQTRHRLPGSLTSTAATADGRPLPPKLPEGVPFRPAQPTLESLHDSRLWDRNMQLASYESAMVNGATPAANAAGAAASVEPERRMTTTSIALPPNFRLPMGAAGAAPTPQAAAARQVPVQPQLQVVPIPLPQPAGYPTTPTPPSNAPAWNGLPGSVPAVPTARFGALGAQSSGAPTVAAAAVYPPTMGGGLGNGHPPAGGQQTAASPTIPPTPRAASARAITWNTAQFSPLPSAPANMPQRQPAYGQLPQPIVQPASQPLPPATGVTTSVSYSTPAAAPR
jgi:hypothetical protein